MDQDKKHIPLPHAPFVKKPYIVPPAPHAILPHLVALTTLAEAAAESTRGYLDNEPSKLATMRKTLFGGSNKPAQFTKDIELLVSKMGEIAKEAETFKAIFYREIAEERVNAAGRNLRSALLPLGNALSSIYQDRGKRGQEVRGVVEGLAKLLQNALLDLALELAGHGDHLVEWNDVFGVIQGCRAGLENPNV